jgi:hypothetical protein
MTQIKFQGSRVPVVHTYNPSLRGRDLEDRSLKPAWAKFMRPYLKKTHYKIGLVEQLKV